jgi:ribose transport system substrate-binding protein
VLPMLRRKSNHVVRRGALITAGLAVCLAGGLTGCGGPAGTSSVVPEVAFVMPNSQLNFAIELADGFRSGVDAVGGVTQTVVGPSVTDSAKELQMFQEVRSHARDGITVLSLAPDLFAQPLADAGRAGIPLIAVGDVPPPTSNVRLFVGNDNYEIGRMLAEEVAGMLPTDASGTIVLGAPAPGVPMLDSRIDGIRDQLRQLLPKVKTLGVFDTKQDVSSNAIAWQTLVNANPDALAFLGAGSTDGFNLAAIHNATRAGWRAGAFDLDPSSLRAVREGNLVLVSPEHYVSGAVAGRLLATHAKDGTRLPTGWLRTPGLVINQLNIAEITARQASPFAKQQWFAKHIDRMLSDPAYRRPLADAGR